MSITKVCKCSHNSGYHKQLQNYKDKKYVGKTHGECQMDNCECPKFDLLAIKQIEYRGNVTK